MMKPINVWDLCPLTLQVSMHPIARCKGNMFYNATTTSDYDCYEERTHFYIEVTKTRKKYYLFGPAIEYKDYEFLFGFNKNIENSEHDLTVVQNEIKAGLERLTRSLEIAAGKIL